VRFIELQALVDLERSVLPGFQDGASINILNGPEGSIVCGSLL
jgi:hypothetical protein